VLCKINHLLLASTRVVFGPTLCASLMLWICSESRSKQHTYDDVVERVALQLGLEDPSKIRLTSHNCYLQQPKPQPIKYRGVERLTDMLVHYNQTSDILYFEMLDLPLPELQGLKTLKIAFHNSKTEEVCICT
jgi:ubiquitin carboxyl-terminal hydrolase 7